MEYAWNVLEGVESFLSFQHIPHQYRAKQLIIKRVDVWNLKPQNIACLFFKTIFS